MKLFSNFYCFFFYNDFIKENIKSFIMSKYIGKETYRMKKLLMLLTTVGLVTSPTLMVSCQIKKSIEDTNLKTLLEDFTLEKLEETDKTNEVKIKDEIKKQIEGEYPNLKDKIVISIDGTTATITPKDDNQTHEGKKLVGEFKVTFKLLVKEDTN